MHLLYSRPLLHYIDILFLYAYCILAVSYGAFPRATHIGEIRVSFLRAHLAYQTVTYLYDFRSLFPLPESSVVYLFNHFTP